MHERQSISSSSETRNSKIRELTASTVHSITEKIRKALPWLHPDHLNVIGVVGVGLGSVLAAHRKEGELARNKKLTGLSLGLITVGSLTDAFDGSLARTLANEGRKINFRTGQIKDVVGDRVQELAMSLSRGVSAHQRGDRIGEMMAFMTAITNTLPSYVRSLSESQGKAVAETGKNWQGIIGTRIGRAVTGTLATLFPEVKGMPTQTIADAMIVSANIMTTLDRLSAVTNNNIIPTLSEMTKEEAQLRRRALGLCVFGAGAAAILTYAHLHKDRK